MPISKFSSALSAVVAGTAVLSVASVASAAPLSFQPSLNMWGGTGLIDLPTAEMQRDGVLNTSFSRFSGITRVVLSYQIFPSISGTFRYSIFNGWNPTFPTKYYDRSFDLRYQILAEHGWQPDLTLGLQDFVGTDLLAAEYLVATKHLTPRLKFTLGLGWGRLGSHGAIGTLFGPRPAIDFGNGGNLSTKQWFRGPAAPFGGVEWAVTDRLRLKAEYSSDAYTREIGQHQMFTRKSSLNAGLEYDLGQQLRLGVYELYGSEIGVSLQFTLDPSRRPSGTIIGPAPIPIRERPSAKLDPKAWSTSWATEPATIGKLENSTAQLLKAEGLTFVRLTTTPKTATLSFENQTLPNGAEAIGRAARVLSQTMPASVETFYLVPVSAGMAIARVTILRKDLEGAEFQPDAAARFAPKVRLSDAYPTVRGALQAPSDKRFFWGLGPYFRVSLFDPNNPFRWDLGAQLNASYTLAPGVYVSGAITKRLAGTVTQSPRTSNSTLPHVRTDYPLYDTQGDPALDHLTLGWYRHPLKNIYTRVTAGYLERMYAGLSGEVLWQPPGSNFAAGAELDYLRQRAYNIRFGLLPYHVVSGFLSLYYTLPGGYLAELDGGKYLAGDKGATLKLTRQFANGWTVGVFATKTNVSAAQFGEGSFDKGFFIQVPTNWFLGTDTQGGAGTLIRPVQRDGGQLVDVTGRLYDTVKAYNLGTLSAQWGRVFR